MSTTTRKSGSNIAAFHAELKAAGLTLEQRTVADAFLLGWVSTRVPVEEWDRGVQAAIAEARRRCATCGTLLTIGAVNQQTSPTRPCPVCEDR